MGTLYVVATPIGNLEDITLRALRILREVQLIAAEDTRRTAKLLQHYSIATPTTSLHEHNEAQKTESLLRRLREGASIALVSDAGTPLVSDPGRHLVNRARKEGIPVVAIPGPSAVMAALSAAGVEASEFRFLGFPPRRSSDLKLWISRYLNSEATVVFFEAPHRIKTTLKALHGILGDRPIIVGRELTKLHEEMVERPISGQIDAFQNPRGEFVIVVPGLTSVDTGDQDSPATTQILLELGQLIDNGRLEPRAAARKVAARYGLGVNAVYKLWAVSRDRSNDHES